MNFGLCAEKINVCRDEEWHDLTAPIGFHVAGAWNNSSYSNDDAVITSAHAGWNRQLLLAADNDGFVRLFRYPCTSTKTEFREAKPFSGAVNAARFLLDDIYAVAVGGTSGSVLVRWKVKE